MHTCKCCKMVRHGICLWNKQSDALQLVRNTFPSKARQDIALFGKYRMQAAGHCLPSLALTHA